MSGKRSPAVFEGLKVVDFCWVAAGPIVTRHLADFGATVIRVESSTRPDVLRTGPPFRDGIPGLDRTAYMPAFNSNKLGITLNLRHPKAYDVALRLIRWADVLAENMAPGSMAKMGLGWDTVSKLNPSAIMYSTSQQGQTGPHSAFGGFGTQAAAYAGFYEVTGWPDREPVASFGAYTDFVSPWLLLVTLIGALDERRRTGQGRYLDQSQFESGLWALGPALMDYAANGRIATRRGNDDPSACPHGAFRCMGTERWVTLAVRTEAEWLALCQVVGRADWQTNDALCSILERRKRKQDLDEGIEAWTRRRSAEEAMIRLQEAGVPAGVVQTAEDLFTDPQLSHRQHFWFMEHPIIGRHAYQAPSMKLSRTPARPARPAPTMGQHNFEVYRDILGYSEDEIAEFVTDGVLD